MYFQKLKTILYLNKVFYTTCLIAWAIGLYFQLTFNQFALSIAVNSSHSAFGDGLMLWMTNMGDGLFLTLIGIVLLFLRKNYWLVILLCLLLPSGFTQLLKHFVFEDQHRPAILMAHINDLYFVEGIKQNRFNSFPSGHTTAAFSLYTLLALMTSNKKIGYIWPIVASIVGLSRVYLMQHFWVDILVGSFIGIVLCTLVFVWVQPKIAFNEI